jgi:hypothetical protein
LDIDRNNIGNNNELTYSSIIDNCIEKYGPQLIDGTCYNCPVCIDGFGKKYYLIPRIGTNLPYVEYKMIPKGKKIYSPK